MTPQEIEDTRKLLKEVLPPSVANNLCALALDGILFRAWINGAQSNACLLATSLANCATAQEHRAAITKLIASGKISP